MLNSLPTSPDEPAGPLDRGRANGLPLAAARYTVPAVARAAQVLDALADSPVPLSLAELSRRLAAPKSSLLNVCTTLVQCRLIAKTGDGMYQLGPRVVDLGRAYLSRLDMVSEFPRACEELGVLAEEAFLLAVLDGRDVLYVGNRKGTRPVAVTYQVGMRLPAHCTATGKALLSALSDQRLAALYGGAVLPALTRHSITSMDRLRQELELTRQRGYATDDEETALAMCCFGAPVRGSSGEVVAAVSVSMMKVHVDAGLATTAAQSVMQLADLLSARLGAASREVRGQT